MIPVEYDTWTGLVALWVKLLLGMPVAHFGVPVVLFPIQLPDSSARLLPPMWEMQMEFQTPGFSLTQL